MSTLNGSVYQKNVSRSVYSDSQYAERTNGYATPKPTMAHLDVPRAPSRARSAGSNYLDVPRAPSRARSPGEVVTQVDPTLEDAQKAGNNYHITMSLNAALADAGVTGSGIMSAGGRASQAEYATLGSRSQGTEYGGTGSRSVSRIDVHGAGGMMPVPAPRTTQSDHGGGGGRSGAVSVVQVDGARELMLLGRASTATPSLSASYSATTHRDLISLNGGGYTIKSVQPSANRKEVQTTLERTSGGGNNTVGFDLELFGGQTTTIKEETTDSAAAAAGSRPTRSGISTLTKSTRESHGGRRGGGSGGREGGSSSWETSYTRHRHHVSDEDDVDRPVRSGKTRKLKTTLVDRGRDTPDFGSVVNEEEDEDLNYTTTEFNRNVSIQRPNAGMIGGGTKRGIGPGGRGTRGVNNYETKEVETVVERQRPMGSPQDRRNPWLLHGDDDDETDQSWAIYRQLVKGAGPGTVHQRVYVEKDEDDIVEDGPQIKDMLNVDTVSEKVLVFVGNDIAEMTIKVRTERIVPIKGSNMFRKSAVTVNRIIEVDMMATFERQRIYENVLDRQRTSGRDLTQKETFDLYKAFLRLAEEDAGDAARDHVQIDKTTDEAQLEELKRASNFYEKRDSFDAGTSNSLGQSRGFDSANRSASRFRESRIQEYGNNDSEFSSAIY